MPKEVGRIAGIYPYYPRVGNYQTLRVLKTKKFGEMFPRWWVQQNPLTRFGKGLSEPKTWFWEVTHYPQDYNDVNYTLLRRKIRVFNLRMWQRV